VTCERARCLLVLPVAPSPTGSGLQQRAHLWLQTLAKKYDVAVWMVLDEGDAVPDLRPPASSTRSAIVSHHRSLMKRLALVCPPLVLARSAWAADWPDFEDALAPSVDNFDLCIVFRIRMDVAAHALLRGGTCGRFLLDMDDLESSTLGSIARFALRRLRLRLAFQHAAKALQNLCLEQTVLRRYDTVFLASEEDAQTLKNRVPDAQIEVLPNLVMPPTLARGAELPGTATMVFLGTLSYFPNEDAALWMMERIVPLIRSRLKKPFRLCIAGRNAGARLMQAMAKTPEVDFLGEVQSVDDVYRGTDLAVVPVRCGGGTKLKALEAIAHGCPVVATQHALRGLGLRSGIDCLAADEAEDFAHACCLLLQDDAMAERMAASAISRQQPWGIEWERTIAVSE
jgi:glycosyltransferase involved in cell wall biosynthesis